MEQNQFSTYARVATGFRSGGSSRNGLDFNKPFDSEEPTSYELGWKSEMLEQRLRVNGAAYFMQNKDIILDYLPDPVARPQLVESFNSGDADVYGLEVDVQAAITDQFLVGVSYTYLNYDFCNVDCPDGTDHTDTTELVWAPENAYSITADYDLSVRVSLADVQMAGHNWQFALWGKNLTDEDSANYKISATALTFQPPLMYGAEVIFEV